MLIAIILGISFYFKYFSSHKNGDYDSCSGSADTQCKICNSFDHRTLYGGPPGECRCNNGTYDDGVNTFCGVCHYTWLIDN